jgi:microcystin-dependent protein
MSGVVSHFVGEIKPWVGTTAPSGWLLCQGQAVSRGTVEGTDYYDLWQVLSNGTGLSPFGNGNGTTTFNVPNLQNRMLVGAASTSEVGLTGGAENVTLTVANLPTHTHTATVSTSGGHTHGGTTTSLSAIHLHAVNWYFTSVGAYAPGPISIAGMESSSGADGAISIAVSNEVTAHAHSFTTDTVGDHTHLVSSTGTFNTSNSNAWTGGVHSNMPPYFVLNYIIKH